ncbi:hypothetical protein [Planococcus soli]|nr:hypothetical protein [Planococcus soli]
MEIETKKKEKKKKKDRWWIADVFEFFISIFEILFYLPRLVLRFLMNW